MTTTPQTPKTPAKARMPRKVKVLLFASLAMNLLIVGLVIGAAARFGGPDGPRHRGDPLIRALGSAERLDVGRAIRDAQGGDRRAFRRAIGGAMEEVARSIEAEPFDAAAFEAAMARKSALLRRSRDAGEARLIEIITAMQGEERKAFAAALRSELERPNHRKKRREREDR